MTKAQIETKADEILNQYTPNDEYPSYYHEANVMSAMGEIAQWMQEKCPRWVKASERMPPHGTSVVIWIQSKNHVGWGLVNYETPSRMYYETATEGLFSDDCLWLFEPDNTTKTINHE